MSDDPQARSGHHAPIGIVEHLCERDGCTAWGAFGYARGKNQPSVWYCREHRNDGERYIGKA